MGQVCQKVLKLKFKACIFAKALKFSENVCYLSCEVIYKPDSKKVGTLYKL